MIAAVYARKSTEQNGVSDDQKSVARQIEHARAYAARHGWSVADECTFVDDGVSGAEFAKRPGFLRLMNALRPRPAFGVLVMSEVSRLGREQIETAYALKQLSVAGVRCFSYLEDRELLLESATDKFLLGAVTFAADLEREKARQRTHDALSRKARAGHVTGGRLFGYVNVDIVGLDGKRSHVERTIDDAEAAIVRRIFALAAEGYGVKGIAKILNGEHAPSPRAQRGRLQSWAPSTVREALHRTTYRGLVTWNQTRKRNRWGQQQQAPRPAGDHLEVPAPQLRIVSDAEWLAAHARLDASRAVYLRGTNGRAFGRPPIGNPSKYLLTSFAECGGCGSTMKVLTRKNGRRRGQFLGCSGYHDRGRAICTNGGIIPLDDADQIVIEAVLDDVLSPDILTDAVDAALALIIGDNGDGRRGQLTAAEREIGRLEAEHTRLVDAIAAGGELQGLLTALKAREAVLASLRTEYERLSASPVGPRLDAGVVRAELLELAADWRQVLAADATHARPILSQLLRGRVRFTPLSTRYEWEMQGQGTIAGLFTRLVAPRVPLGGTSPPGFEPGFWP